MKVEEVAWHAIVRVQSLGGVNGLLCEQHYLDARREGACGKILAFFREDWADSAIVFVSHGNTEAAYWAHELQLIGSPESR